jgi:hypothetical protein
MSGYETPGERLRRERAEKKARGEWTTNEEPYVPEPWWERPLVDGTADAVSRPIEEGTDLDAFMRGRGAGYVLPVGSGKNRDGTRGSVPRKLRKGGYIYLRTGSRLVARARFIKVHWQTRRVEHLPSPTGYENAGPGYVLLVDPSSWEHVSHPLSPSETGNGYRYYIETDDGPVFVRSEELADA